jgi:hypothetical protein
VSRLPGRFRRMRALEHVRVAVVGGGPAGLAISRELAERAAEHVVLERGQVGQRWRDRWDSFCLVTPNWMVQLPGGHYDGSDPDGFMPRDEIVAYLERYAARIEAPVGRRGRRGESATATLPGGCSRAASWMRSSLFPRPPPAWPPTSSRPAIAAERTCACEAARTGGRPHGSLPRRDRGRSAVRDRPGRDRGLGRRALRGGLRRGSQGRRRARARAAEDGILRSRSTRPRPSALTWRGVGAVIFAGGFRPDYGSWLPRPAAFDDLGLPIQRDGASTVVPACTSSASTSCASGSRPRWCEWVRTRRSSPA